MQLRSLRASAGDLVAKLSALGSIVVERLSYESQFSLVAFVIG
jgi:hypothetical protein